MKKRWCKYLSVRLSKVGLFPQQVVHLRSVASPHLASCTRVREREREREREMTYLGEEFLRGAIVSDALLVGWGDGNYNIAVRIKVVLVPQNLTRALHLFARVPFRGDHQLESISIVLQEICVCLRLPKHIGCISFALLSLLTNCIRMLKILAPLHFLIDQVQILQPLSVLLSYFYC